MRVPRRLRSIVRRRADELRPVILMYHRVAELTCDPWELAVQPALFAEQIEALTQERSVVPLRWLATQLAKGHAPKGTAAVTFDDGYVDVLTNARPILERHQCPATVFLTTGAIGSSKEFWWDELTRIVLESPSLPARLKIELDGRVHEWELEDPSSESSSESLGQARTTKRSELHLALWRLLKPLEEASRLDILETLSDWAGIDRRPRPGFRTLDPDEVRRLADPALVDIGAHTVTHPSMPLLDSSTRRDEVEGSRRACEEITGTEIEAFAYPFGDLDDPSVATVRDAGFTIACSTEHAMVTTRPDLLRLPRIGIGSWSAAELMRQLDAARR